MDKLLVDVNRRYLNLKPLDLAAYFWDTRSDPIYPYLRDHATSLIADRGGLYAPLRQYIDVEHLDRAKVFAMLRDPRDKIVSGYFSVRFSHRSPNNGLRRKNFQSSRRNADELTIDEYALQQAPIVKEVYCAYRKNLDRDVVLTYEQMWHDFDSWARCLASRLDVSFTQDDVARYRKMAGVDEQRSENQHSHRRRGMPGDYLNKLSPAVIEQLNEVFADELNWLYQA
tara:strand:+ start:250 stop:930 length:681 start_codon:yes stop_codon:yes gene_type:complete